MTNPKDPTEQRIEKLERTADNLRWHLLTALQLNHALASEIALLAGHNPNTDANCIKALQEFNALNTLRPVRADFNRQRQ